MQQDTHTIVMARVRRVHFLRKFMQPFALKCYALAVAVLGSISYVSVVDVVNNARSISSLEGLLSFSESALLNTELAVQLAIVVGVVAVGLLARDIIRGQAPRMVHQPVRLS